MRCALALVVLAACLPLESGIVDVCTERGDYVLCLDGIPYYEALDVCAHYGAELVNVEDTDDPLRAVADVVDAAEGIDAWWSGWPSEYECPAMSRFGSASPQECDRSLPVVCVHSG